VRRAATALPRRAGFWPQLELFVSARPVAAPAPVSAAPVRWDFTRPWLVSPHLARARRTLDEVRAHFPELDDAVIRVGLTKRRTILGLASLGEVPMIWIRPRRILRFAIAHELTHLLQARGLVGGGEKTADLYALARSAAYVDVAPFYLKVPSAFVTPGRERALAPAEAHLLWTLAAEAIAGRTPRSAIRHFERRAHEAAARRS